MLTHLLASACEFAYRLNTVQGYRAKLDDVSQMCWSTMRTEYIFFVIGTASELRVGFRESNWFKPPRPSHTHTYKLTPRPQ